MLIKGTELIKLNNSGDLMYSMMILVYNTLYYILGSY